MALTGQAKKDNEFVRPRAVKQTEFWGSIFKSEESELAGRDDIDPEVLITILNPNKRFRSEALSTEDLWFKYIGIEKESEEEIERRGRGKKSKETRLEPIRARRLPGRFSDDGYLTFTNWLYARDQARKDLLWLSTSVLGETRVDPFVHQIICDQFIQPNFDGVYHGGYALEEVQSALDSQSRVPRRWNEEHKNYVTASQEDLENEENRARMMILLDARGFYKSTLNRAHAIQMILNCPDITMMIMTAATSLATAFVQIIKMKFYLPRGGEPKPLQLLFPEYVLRGVDGTSAEPLLCPARIHERPYPTLWANSVGSVLAGWHCDYGKFDDAIEIKNSNTDTLRKQLRNEIDNIMNLIDPWGKVDMIGTRYFPDDYYGTRKTRSDDDPEDYTKIKYFVRSAWTPKSQAFAEIEKKDINKLTLDMVTLAFPHQKGDPERTFAYLKGILRNNEQTFRCQQLNQPVWGDSLPSFKIEDLKAPHRQMNIDYARRLPGEVKILWDPAKTANKNSDYTAGAAFKIFQKEDKRIAAILLEVVYDKWTQTEIVHQMIELDHRWQLWSTARIVNRAEDTGGLDLMKIKVIQDAVTRYGTPPQFYWIPPTNETNAKRNRIKGLEILLQEDRLFFADGAWLHSEDGVFAQLVAYKGEKSSRTRKDDIPDAMSWITAFLPNSVQLTEEEKALQDIAKEAAQAQTLLRAQHERIFGRDVPGNPFLASVEDDGQPSSPYGDISKRLFGGNGMRA
jgi:hypothetical protein